MADLERQYPQYVSIFREKMPNATAGQIYMQMKKTFDNPNDQDYKDFAAAYKQKTGKDYAERYGAPRKYASHEEYKAANGITMNVAESMHDYSKGPYTDQATIAPSFGGTGSAVNVGEGLWKICRIRFKGKCKVCRD